MYMLWPKKVYVYEISELLFFEVGLFTNDGSAIEEIWKRYDLISKFYEAVLITFYEA